MKQTVLSAFTACTMLGAATIGMPAAAEAQTIIIINGNQPYSQPYSYPYPQRHHVVYDYPGYYGAGYGDGITAPDMVTVGTTAPGMVVTTVGIIQRMDTGIVDHIGDGSPSTETREGGRCTWRPL